MRLFHFTAEHLADSIESEGITMGAVITHLHPIRHVRDYVWLTKAPHWNQSWCEQRSLIPYDRSAIRFTVDIPKIAEKKLRPWILACESLCSPEARRVLNAYGDPEHWYLFKGVVRPSWIVAKFEKPAPPEQITISH